MQAQLVAAMLGYSIPGAGRQSSQRGQSVCFSALRAICTPGVRVRLKTLRPLSGISCTTLPSSICTRKPGSVSMMGGDCIDRDCLLDISNLQGRVDPYGHLDYDRDYISLEVV
jgi:hypothetical protein